MTQNVHNSNDQGERFNDFESLMKETAQFIISNLEGDSSQAELFKLQGVMKKFAETKKTILRENQVLAELKQSLESADRPWEHDVYKMFEDKVSYIDDQITPDVSTNVDYVECLKNDAVMESNDVKGTYKDPWTKLPIQDPVQSNTCKHFYERTIVYGILKKKKEFRCPYLGCVHVIKESNIMKVSL